MKLASAQINCAHRFLPLTVRKVAVILSYDYFNVPL
uniref:Uncharacterized protein n=1 Tax=Arundo donax TaxID=35708 RepID=A0A0A9F0V5_ARUDO